MAIVLQDPFLFTGTVLSNITLNREDISRDDAKRALLEVGGKCYWSVWKRIRHGGNRKGNRLFLG